MTVSTQVRMTGRDDPDAVLIREQLGKHFCSDSQVDAYRYNAASVRVRILSPIFDGKNRVQREEIIEPMIATLPESVQIDIVMLLLLTPSEHSRRLERMDLLDIEFDQPSKSSL